MARSARPAKPLEKSSTTAPPRSTRASTPLSHTLQANSQNLSPSQILTLQRTIGNRAVLQLLTNRTPIAPIQRGRQIQTRRKKKSSAARRRATVSLKGTQIMYISFKGVRRPRTTGRKQGDHGTAFVTITERIRNQFQKTPRGKFVAKVKELAKEMKAIPQMKKLGDKAFAQRVLANALVMTNNIDVNTAPGSQFGDIMYELAEAWNSIPGGAVVHTTSTGGHNEAGHNAILRDANNKLGKGLGHGYTKKQLDEALWGLFDYMAGPTAKATTIADKVVRHIRHMSNTYKHVVTARGGLKHMYKLFRDTYWENVFIKMKTHKITKRDDTFEAIKEELDL